MNYEVEKQELELLNSFNNSNQIIKSDSINKLLNKFINRTKYFENKINTLLDINQVNDYLNQLTLNNISKTAKIIPPIYFEYGVNTSIGENTIINQCCTFNDKNKIQIGKNCFIGQRCNFRTDLDPNIEISKKTLVTKPIIIFDNVWIGSNVTVMAGVTIGEKSIIANGSCVTFDIPSNALYAGNPARFVKWINQKPQKLPIFK